MGAKVMLLVLLSGGSYVLTTTTGPTHGFNNETEIVVE